MIDAGVDPAKLGIVVAAIERDMQGKARSAAAERQARYRERKAIEASNVTNNVTGDVTSNATGAKKETPPDPLKKKPTPVSPSLRSGDLSPTPLDELCLVLDGARAAAVVEHRKRLRKPLTAYAARQLAAKLAEVPEPNAAADEMIANGWQGFSAHWLERMKNRGPPQQSGNGYFQILREGKTDEPSRHSPAETQRTTSGKSGPVTLDLVADQVHPERRQPG